MEEEVKQEVETPTAPVVPTPQEEKPKKNILLFVIISLVVLIGVGVLLLVLLTGNKSDDKPKDNEQKEEEKKEEEKEETKKDYKIDIYRYNEGIRGLCFNNDPSICKDYAFSIETETDDAEPIETDDTSNLFVLYYDNGMKVYDVTKKTSQKVNVKKGYDHYQLFLNNDKTKLIGILYNSYDYTKKGFYNVTLDKTLYETKYNVDTMNQISDKAISLSLKDDKGVYLLSTEKEEELLYEAEDEDSALLEFRSYDDGIYTLEECAAICEIVKVYNTSLKEITNKVQTMTVYNKNIYVLYENVITKYDLDGNVVSTFNDFGKIDTIIRDYVVYIKDNKVILGNMNNKSESKELATINNDTQYVDDFTSGYYTKDDLKYLNESDKPEGLYVVIVYSTKDANGNYGMEYCYNTSTKQVQELPIKEEVGGRAKPVLYLYTTKDTNVKVEFEHPEYLTTTYPKYNKSWNVLAKPNGDLYDNNGKYYYALYWDETRYNEVDFKEGFYVESKDAIKFLEEKLTTIGLNDKERNEFIMYWLPILEKNGKSLVYFELTEERESSNKLLIAPKPDSMLRVSIHIKKVDNKVNIKEQKLNSFKRTGFTVVEWGGMTY